MDLVDWLRAGAEHIYGLELDFGQTSTISFSKSAFRILLMSLSSFKNGQKIKKVNVQISQAIPFTVDAIQLAFEKCTGMYVGK